MPHQTLAEEIYDQGPTFEAGNQVNREAWVRKIRIALDQVRQDAIEDCAKVAEIEWMHGKGALKRGQELVSGLGERIAKAIIALNQKEGDG